MFFPQDWSKQRYNHFVPYWYDTCTAVEKIKSERVDLTDPTELFVSLSVLLWVAGCAPTSILSRGTRINTNGATSDGLSGFNDQFNLNSSIGEDDGNQNEPLLFQV